MPTITCIGLAFVVLGIYFMRREHKIILDSPKAEARIIELAPGRTYKSGATDYAPKASFKTMGGAEIVFTMAASTKPSIFCEILPEQYSCVGSRVPGKIRKGHSMALRSNRKQEKKVPGTIRMVKAYGEVHKIASHLPSDTP